MPRGVLDSLSPDEIMRAQSEEECVQLVRLLSPTDAALLDWAINLMADVAQLESFNKMNARNIAMVFAPNMIQFQVWVSVEDSRSLDCFDVCGSSYELSQDSNSLDMKGHALGDCLSEISNLPDSTKDELGSGNIFEGLKACI
ncbi:hypothetical protein HAX54_011769 [Datura stramonium]|uniref:Rho-GAP domain-containing protein n=1 Tax=Datura stramonium TaxID=4076 RepID=A0ABS8TKD7_DATST|nr:hypothetical protein [Datura stramonium]